MSNLYLNSKTRWHNKCVLKILCLFFQVLEKERELGRVLEEIRPLSDGAAYEHSQILNDPGVLSVKRRDTLSPNVKHQVIIIAHRIFKYFLNNNSRIFRN